MAVNAAKLLSELRAIVAARAGRVSSLEQIAELLKFAGDYRWVGLYDVDHRAGVVKNVVWSGPGAPEYPVFPIAEGLTGAAISAGKTIKVGNVAADPRYLTAFPSTRSEIIVPVFDTAGKVVLGTIDVESESENAFDDQAQSLLERCSKAIQALWQT